MFSGRPAGWLMTSSNNNGKAYPGIVHQRHINTQSIQNNSWLRCAKVKRQSAFQFPARRALSIMLSTPLQYTSVIFKLYARHEKRFITFVGAPLEPLYIVNSYNPKTRKPSSPATSKPPVAVHGRPPQMFTRLRRSWEYKFTCCFPTKACNPHTPIPCFLET